MNVIILGSGGCVSTPRACCNCRVCTEARQKVEHILYSHCDPDHTMGMRVIEQLKMDWLADSLGKKPDSPIEISSLPTILEDIKKQGTKYGSFIQYYEAKGLVCAKEIRAFKKDNILIELVPVDEQEHVAIQLLETY